MRPSRAVLPVLAALVLAALVAPGAAPAKGVKAITVCGASGCQDVDRKGDLEWMVGGSTPINAPGKPAPFYRVKVTIGEPGFSDHWTMAYVPSLHYVRGTDNNGGDPVWTLVQAPQSLQAFERATRGLEPYPASKLGALEPAKVPEAQVVEVYEPNRGAPAGHDGGTSLWVWLATAAAALALGGLALTARHRIRTPTAPSTPPSAAPPGPR